MGYRLCFANTYFDKEKNKCVVEIQGGLNIMRFFNKFDIDETVFWEAIRNIKRNEDNEDEDFENQTNEEIEVEIKNSFSIKIMVDYHEYYSGADREEHEELSVKMFVFINKGDMRRFASLWVRDKNQKNNWQLRSYEELLNVAGKM